MKKLALDTAYFNGIITDNRIYVDKTEYIYNFLDLGKYFFLSRPRRFGKSTLVSTLNALFDNKKDLFKDTWIFTSDWEWQQYPVILIDWSCIDRSTPHALTIDLKQLLDDIANNHEIDTSKHTSPSAKLRFLVQTLAKQGKPVVVLMDEYDKPILDHINNPDIAEQMRDMLAHFYDTFKGLDKDLKCIFITGVGKFTKTSIFSGLNNLQDLSTDSRFNALVGYTEQEIKDNFGEHLALMAQSLNISQEELLNNFKEMYNGYCFSPDALDQPKIYNPFSIVRSLNQKKLASFWFESGTPSFLIKLIKQRQSLEQDFIDATINSDDFNAFDIQQMSLKVLMFQSGYLTIKNQLPDHQSFMLGFPNQEVSRGFSAHLLKIITGNDAPHIVDYGPLMRQALAHDNLSVFVAKFQEYLKLLPYTSMPKSEREVVFERTFIGIAIFLGIDVKTQVPTFDGRLDAVIHAKSRTYIFEFKVKREKSTQATLDEACQQLETKKYHEFYLNQQKHFSLVGLVVDPETAEVTWQEIKLDLA